MLIQREREQGRRSAIGLFIAAALLFCVWAQVCYGAPTVPHEYPLYVTDSGAGSHGTDYVYRINSNGTVDEVVSGEYLTAITVGPSGDLYVGQEDGTIFRVDGQGNKHSYTTSLGGSVRGLAFGPDGYLYVGNQYGGNMYRISPTMSQTLFSTVGTCVQGLAFDSSGDLYAATGGWGDNRILRINAAGTPHDFASAHENPVPLSFDLTGFPGGFLLSSENEASLVPAIIKIASDGSVANRVEFPGHTINGLCVTADGYIYATYINSILQLNDNLELVGTIADPRFDCVVGITATPEPATLSLVAVGIGTLLLGRRRK
jgi:sugar lactone lactonase YvrE